jgi:hypothetical protein
MLVAAVLLVLMAGAFIAPGAARCEEPEIYYGRHFTLWYYTLSDFRRFESVLREPPLGRMPGYGPESEYMGRKLERLYAQAVSELKVNGGGSRLLVVLLDARSRNRDIFNERGHAVIQGGAYYDPESKAVYVDTRSVGMCGFVKALIEAVMDNAEPALCRSRARTLVSVPAAQDICTCTGPYGEACFPPALVREMEMP